MRIDRAWLWLRAWRAVAVALGIALAIAALRAAAQSYLISEALDIGGTDLAIGPAGQIYVAGVAGSYDLPAVDSGAILNAGFGMRYVARMDVAARKPVWVAIVGPATPTNPPSSRGIAEGEARGLALRGDGSTFLVAYDGSRNYPLAGGPYRWAAGKYVFQVDPGGQVSRYSVALDPAVRRVSAIALDSAGSIYLTGNAGDGLATTSNAPFPTSSVAAGCIAPFAMKLDATGQFVVYATYLGYAGTQGERCGGGSTAGVVDPVGYAIAVDSTGNAVIGGQAEPGVRATTGSPDTGSKQVTLYIPEMASYASHGFVTKLNAAGSAVVFTARLGGYARDRITSVALDASGAVYLGGKTSSSDFPTKGGAGPIFPLALRTCPGFDNAPEMGFVAKLSPDGKQIVYSAFLPVGGSQLANCGGNPGGYFAPVTVAVDASGRLYATGVADSERVYNPPLNAIATINGSALLYVVASDGSAVEYYTQYGRPRPNAIALDGFGELWVAGNSLSRFSAGATPVEFTNAVPLCATGGTVSVRVAGAGNAGSVEFFIDGSSVGIVPVSNGSASKWVVISPGARRVLATYRGASYFDGYLSDVRYMPVNQAGACP